MTVIYHVTLTPEQEVADVTSTASGSGWVIFDSEAVAATYLFDVDGFDFTFALSGPPPTLPTPPAPAGSATRTHFHAQARDLNGGIVFGQLDPYDDMDDLAVVANADGSWSVSGSWEATDAKPITGTFPRRSGTARHLRRRSGFGHTRFGGTALLQCPHRRARLGRDPGATRRSRQ